MQSSFSQATGKKFHRGFLLSWSWICNQQSRQGSFILLEFLYCQAPLPLWPARLPSFFKEPRTWSRKKSLRKRQGMRLTRWAHHMYTGRRLTSLEIIRIAAVWCQYCPEANQKVEKHVLHTRRQPLFRSLTPYSLLAYFQHKGFGLQTPTTSPPEESAMSPAA